ncbi:MAG: vitamin K epoxide reductase family protein [Chloroflexi bacterium]|nr:vitamin K epoxide reductase family protein [Chloroflexota bacterium]
MTRLVTLLALILLATARTVFSVSAQTAKPPIVHAVLFWMNGCPHCEEVIQNVLPPLREKFGEQFDLSMIEVVTMQDVEILYEVAASYNISKEQTGVPFLIIGDHVLIGSQQILDELPNLIERYLAQGGVDLPANPTITKLLSQTSPAFSSTPNLPAVTEPAPPIDMASVTSTHMQSNGFTLAIIIMIGMGLVLLYSLIAFAFGKTFQFPAWGDWLIPILILIGIGVASYLSYVETQSVEAVCGSVGDCNTVQQSRYARLFDILPVGVLGLMGYIALLAAWLVRRFIPKLEKHAAIGFFSMAFFAVVFSLYLTYLEPFVIRAVCIWCLSSAVIMTLLLLLAIPSTIRQFALSEDK